MNYRALSLLAVAFCLPAVLILLSSNAVLGQVPGGNPPRYSETAPSPGNYGPNYVPSNPGPTNVNGGNNGPQTFGPAPSPNNPGPNNSGPAFVPSNLGPAPSPNGAGQTFGPSNADGQSNPSQSQPKTTGGVPAQGTPSTGQFQPLPNLNNGGSPNGQSTGGQPATQQQQSPGVRQPVGPPFQLTMAEQQVVDGVLLAWEKKPTKNFSANFVRWDYDANFAPKEKQYLYRDATGFVKYQAPDKGQFRVDKITEINLTKAKYDQVSKVLDPTSIVYEEKADAAEEWRCNGNSTYQFDYKKKLLTERVLPKEVQGKAIINTPLPFVFGAEAAAIKNRFWVRIITPPNVKDQIWIQAFPKTILDAVNYEHVDIILTEKEMIPVALQLFLPTAPSADGKPVIQSRQVYSFTPVREIWSPFSSDFSTPSAPFGWKTVKEDLNVAPSADKGTQPVGANDPNRQAKQPVAPNNQTQRR